jgi:hypothetical protein
VAAAAAAASKADDGSSLHSQLNNVRSLTVLLLQLPLVLLLCLCQVVAVTDQLPKVFELGAGPLSSL